MLQKNPSHRPSIREILSSPLIAERLCPLPDGCPVPSVRPSVRIQPPRDRGREDRRLSSEMRRPRRCDRPDVVRRKSANSDLAELYRQQRREARRNRERFEAAERGLDLGRFVAETEADPGRMRIPRPLDMARIIAEAEEELRRKMRPQPAAEHRDARGLFFVGDSEVDLPVVRDTDSLMYRAEAIRAFREKQFGLGGLIELYAAIAGEGCTRAEVDRMVAHVEPGLVVLLQQLLILDEKISEQ
jgi:hypothetical protein